MYRVLLTPAGETSFKKNRMLDFSSIIQRTKVEMKMPREERLIEEEVSEKVAYKCEW